VNTLPLAPPSLLPRWLPLVVAMVVATIGWQLTWFFCDDAFINYRFCGNAYDGHGFVWNPPPYLPVEGYTSFGWVAGLYLLWQLTGLAPPSTAIPIAYGAGLGILWLADRWLWRQPHFASAPRLRPWLQGAVLVGIAANHSFATWLSSGMETSVYALIGLGFTLRAFAMRPAAAGADLWVLALLAALAHLIRPDGDLLVLAVLAIAGHAIFHRWLPLRRALLSLLPLLVPVAHVLWRKWFYGEWQPNTYYAKVVGPWPESGLRYLYCYVVEHGVWLWLPLALAWAAVMLRRHGLRPLFGLRAPAVVAVGAWLAHVGYYTLVVGGDHFAYRVFLHLVPLWFLSAFAMLGQLRVPAATSLAGLLALLLAASVPGWWMERALVGRELEGFVRVVPQLPAPLRPLLRRYDQFQAWLLVHSVGFRRPLHAVSCAAQLAVLPERRPGYVEGAKPGQRLLLRADAIGVLGWSLADVAILDGHGLCDWVIARHREPPPPIPLDLAQVRAAFGLCDRNGDGRLDPAELAEAAHLLRSIGPQLPPATWAQVLLALADADGDEHLTADELVAAVAQLLPPRQMAHERHPPPGYIEALRPNVVMRDGRRMVDPEVVPLTDAELRAVEQEWRQRMRK
jgi:arabinofuranosyltransferase